MMPNLWEQYLNLIKRFIPVKLHGSCVGLDIGAADCKFVQVQKGADGFSLLDWGIQPTNQDTLEATIKKIRDRLKTPFTSVHTSVSGRGTLIRYISMPRMSLEDLRNSFAIEVDKYFPFTQDQVYTDCCILDPQGKGKDMSVIAAAAKKELVDQRVQLLSKLGITTDFIGINPVALVNGFHVLGTGLPKEEGAVVALLDIGETVSNLTILMDQLPRFTRDIFVGGRDCTKVISNVFGISIDEADKLKRQPGDKAEQVMSAYESMFLSMIQELKLSFDYFTTEKNLEIKQLFLTGGGSTLGGIVSMLEKAFDLKVDLWDPVKFLKVSTGMPEGELSTQSIRLGVAVGLALYSYD